ncbi:hypothetical protein D9615_000328 [Tricholomella constricta]|uniref:Uncharacterized protein n=1 Tax=Tricholomella constricta TaxID=117010 RepID=A0A8H5MC93_9AGAR|nr:hypothetical protein D9615_000328 [Tricholomella constricta]
MKPVSFLRNTWRKKDGNSSTKSQPPAESILREVPPVPPLKPAYSEATTVLSLEFDSTFQDSQNSITGRVLVNGPDNWESIHAQIVPKLRGKHGSFFHSSHGPPHNPSHGPPSLYIESQSLQSRGPPHRPPRPPSLNLFSQPQFTARSPTRVKFAPEPQIRPSHPSSSLGPAFRRNGRDSQCPVAPETGGEGSPQDLKGVQDRPDHDVHEILGVEERLSHSHRPTFDHHLSKPSPLAPSPLADSLKTEYAVLVTDAPKAKSLYHATSSSTPHLPLSTTSSRPIPEPRNPNVDSLRSSRETLASFPKPPPLRFRKRPKPLVLLPTPTVARLPPSPLISSIDSTPVATPTTSICSLNTMSPMSSRFPGRRLHTVSPPSHGPPNSPLPTPPLASGFFVPPGRDTYPKDVGDRALRTAQSTSGLREQSRFEQLHPVHRVTSSAPASDLFTTRVAVERRVDTNSGLESLEYRTYTPSYAASDPPINWGYAV